MTSAELVTLLASEKEFLADLPDLQEAILCGPALQEGELVSANLLLIPARALSTEERTALQQAVLSRFKDRVPVPFEAMVATPELDVPQLAERAVPMRVVFTR